MQRKAVELKQEREAKEQEIKSLHEKEQWRLREERQLHRQRRPASAATGQ